MTDYRKNLVDRMIALYGSESEIVKMFIDMAGKYRDSADWDHAMLILVNAHEQYPVTEQ